MAPAHRYNTRLQPLKNLPCHFFKLPAELRNQVYQLVLVEDEVFDVNFNANPPLDHPLLITFRLVRAGACEIYYEENRMIWHVQFFDVSRLVKWLDLSDAHWDLYRESNSAMHLTYKVTEHKDGWPNLLNWVDLYWQHRCRRIDHYHGAEVVGRAVPQDRVVEFFNLVDKLVDTDGMTWKKLSAALEKHRRTAMIPGCARLPMARELWE